MGILGFFCFEIQIISLFWGKFSKFLIYREKKEKKLVPCMKRDGMDLNSFSMERIQIV